MIDKGYKVKEHDCPVKRYCQTLDLKDDPLLIEEYIKRHSEAQAWPEIREGIRSVGVLEMEIYIVGFRLFMIVETPLDFDWEIAMGKLATLLLQEEWEECMSVFQVCEANSSSTEKWKLMERVSYLYD